MAGSDEGQYPQSSLGLLQTLMTRVTCAHMKHICGLTSLQLQRCLLLLVPTFICCYDSNLQFHCNFQRQLTNINFATTITDKSSYSAADIPIISRANFTQRRYR